MKTGINAEKAKHAQAELAKYTKPQTQFIGQSHAAKKLYSLEEKRNQIIKEAAKEWAKINELPTEGDSYWHRSIPQALYDTLGSYSDATGAIAAEAYLEMLGYEITRPKFD